METFGFRDIIGPVMVGPSSSHTAGALRIARMGRRLIGAQPSEVKFTLYQSFAHTGKGHGTDKALVAGMLDFDTDDLRIRDSFEIAREQGMAVEVIFDTETKTEHPNTVDIDAVTEDGRKLHMRGVSVGGGAVSIRNIDGIDVDITGENTSLVCRQTDVKGVLAHIAGCLAEGDVNIATTKLFRERKGATAFCVMEIDSAVPREVREAILEHPYIHEARVVPAMTDDVHDVSHGDAEELEEAKKAAAACEVKFAEYDFRTGEELLALCAVKQMNIGALYHERQVYLEAAKNETTEERARESLATYGEYVLDVMEAAAVNPLVEPTKSMGGLIGGEAATLAQIDDDKLLVDDLTHLAMRYGMAVLETNACMGRIVAAPTAGSAGVIPAVLLALQDKYEFTREELVEALHCAAAVGQIIAQNATVSGAEGGCQAEVGAACGMAAAAAVQLCGGAPEECLDAAANALMALMGLVCDPVRGLVEVPCQKRNATAAATALVCAQMALAGIPNLVPFDETVDALNKVGRSLPFELRESALGGIAACPSARGVGTGNVSEGSSEAQSKEAGCTSDTVRSCLDCGACR